MAGNNKIKSISKVKWLRGATESGLHISSQRYFGAKALLRLRKKQDFVYSGSQNWEPAQIIDHMSAAYVRVWWQKSNQPGCSIQNRLLRGVRTLRSLHKVDYPTLCCISRKTRTPR